MSGSELKLVPESAAEAWRAHAWHEEIKDFSLPEKTLISLGNAIVSRAEYLGAERARGGVYSAQGDYIPVSRHLRRSKDFTADNPEIISVAVSEKIPGRYIYLGWFFNHYGHFVLESLSRCWALVDAGKIDGVVMHLHAPDGVVSPYLLDFFELLSIPGKNIVFAQQDLQFEQLLLPSQQAVLSRAVSADMRALYRHLGERAASLKGKDSPAAEKLYVSRRLLPHDQRKASNEKSLEACFQADGYQVIHPQFMDVISQLALFYNAKKFAGLEGSGLHNIVFARHPEHVWMLGAQESLADAVTQVFLDEVCDCATELHLQTMAASTCLHPRITPVLVKSTASDDGCLSGIKPTTYERFLWLLAFSRQLKSKDCSVDSDEQLAASLSQDEQIALHYLMGEKDKCSLTDAGEMSVFLRVENAVEIGDYCQALELMERQLPENENNPDYLRRLAEMLLKDQRSQEALHLLEKALQLDADNPQLLLERLSLPGEKPLPDSSRLRRLAGAYPRHFPLQIKLAEDYADKGEFKQAVTVLHKVLAQSVRHQWLYARLTWYCFKAGDYEQAKQAAQLALQYQPENPFSFTHLARIHLALSEPEQALVWVGRAIERSPGKEELQQLQQRIEVQCGKHTP